MIQPIRLPRSFFKGYQTVVKKDNLLFFPQLTPLGRAHFNFKYLMPQLVETRIVVFLHQICNFFDICQQEKAKHAIPNCPRANQSGDLSRIGATNPAITAATKVTTQD